MAVSGQARVLSKFLMRQWVARGMLPKHNPASCDHVLVCACSNADACIIARTGVGTQLSSFIFLKLTAVARSGYSNHIPEANSSTSRVYGNSLGYTL